MIKKLLSLFTILYFNVLFSQNVALSENATISIFTCGKGAELYTTFGHTAIRIKDDTHQLDVVYNYGSFDFNEGNFYLKFVKGDLQYFESVSSYQDFIFEYQYYGREVIEQTLNLTSVQKQQLFDQLNLSLFSNEKYYTYKFIDRNCTTMVVEKINKIVGQTLIKKVDDQSISYRKLLYPYFEDHFWYKLGINIIFGEKVDRKAEKLFLPIELLHSLDQASINGKPIVFDKKTVIQEVENKVTFSYFNSIFFIATILLLIVFLRKRFVLLTYLFICGLLGLFLSVVGFYSLHEELLWNYNALLFNPLFVLLPFINKGVFEKVIKISFVMLVIYALYIINKAHLFIMLPFILSHFIMLFLLYKSNRK